MCVAVLGDRHLGQKQMAAGLVRHRARMQRLPSLLTAFGTASCISQRPTEGSHSIAMHTGIAASIARCRAALWAKQARLHAATSLILVCLDEK